MQQTAFLENCYTAKPQSFYRNKIEEDFFMWLPVIMGLATKEEVEYMTTEQLGLLFEAAKMKKEIMEQGGGVNG